MHRYITLLLLPLFTLYLSLVTPTIKQKRNDNLITPLYPHSPYSYKLLHLLQVELLILIRCDDELSLYHRGYTCSTSTLSYRVVIWIVAYLGSCALMTRIRGKWGSDHQRCVYHLSQYSVLSFKTD
uniref:Uncharacterized protein n=1 Tax=Austropuccinia psidii TaxID=181123 RepID=A0A513X012_9BASI|nr:hypothetical protein [Austropuccinia psidii]QDH07273.1 hypothetical protein [Austropuccinia psidii]